MRAFKPWVINGSVLLATLLLLFVVSELVLRSLYDEQEMGVTEFERCMREKSKTLSQAPTWKSEHHLYDLNGSTFTVYDPYLGRKLRPAYQSWQLTTVFGIPQRYVLSTIEHINAGGMRSRREYLQQKSQFRILNLGDSYTYGDDVGVGLTFSELFEQYNTAEMLNFGFPGAGVDYMYLLYTQHASQWESDVVVLHIIANDVERMVRTCNQPNLELQKGKVVLSNTPVPTIEEYVNHTIPPESYAIAFVKQRLMAMFSTQQNDNLALFTALVLDLRDKTNNTLIVSLLPSSLYDESPREQKLYTTLRELLQAHTIPYIDGERLLRNELDIYVGDSLDYFYYPGGHFTGLGNAVYSRILSESLSDHGLIAKTPVRAFRMDTSLPGIHFLNASGQSIGIYAIGIDIAFEDVESVQSNLSSLGRVLRTQIGLE